MGVITNLINKPFNPRGNDQSPLAFNKAAIYSGKALDFDGVNDTINVGRPSYMNITNGAISLACYARLDSTAANGHFFRQENGTPRILFAYQAGALDGISFGTYDGSAYSELDIALEPSEKSAITNDVCFVVATQDTNGTRAIYLNGVLIGSDTRAQGVTCTNTGDLHIGSAAGGGEFWDGLIANAKLFDVALTPAQIADLYNFPEKIVPTGVANTALKLWLPMQEGAGTTAYDGAPLAALGGNIVRNKNFATDSEWNKESGWSISGGFLVATSASGTAAYQTGNGLVSGKTYKVEFEIKDYTTGAVGLRAGTGSSLVTFNTNGVHSINMVASGALQIRFDVSGSTTLKVDNVSVQEVNPSRNHGTISGATYVNGVGAPVAQTAVIDWNKGTNILEYTENPDDNGNFSARGFTKNSSTETSPIGTNDAHKYTEDGTNGNSGLVYLTDYSSGSSQTFKVYLKADAATSLALSTNGHTSGGNINVTTEWQQFEVTQSVNTTSGPHIGGFATITQGSGIVLYMWHPQMSYGDSVYIPTIATAQTSPVLLPQGLTAGRDITGVNLFENVRKQGALNLDGNSWAEVHDNASLDIVDEVTLELWYYHKETSNIPQLIGKRKNGDANWLRIYSASTNTVKLERGPSGAASGNFAITENAWNHITATIDSSDNMKFYIGGVQVGSASSFAPWGLNTTGVLSIGAWINNGNVTTNSIASGQIAQPRIYNRALTAEEVQRNYDAGKNIYS